MELIQRGLDSFVDDPNYCYGLDAQDGGTRNALFRINNLVTGIGERRRSFQIFAGLSATASAGAGTIQQAVGDDHFVSSVHSAVFKVPHRGYPVPWHQDPVNVFRFPVFNVDIYLDEATTQNGRLYVIPGSHLAGYHAGIEFVESWTGGREEDAPGAIRGAHGCQTLGDVLFHSTTVAHGLVLEPCATHCAGPSTSISITSAISSLRDRRDAWPRNYYMKVSRTSSPTPSRYAPPQSPTRRHSPIGRSARTCWAGNRRYLH